MMDKSKLTPGYYWVKRTKKAQPEIAKLSGSGGWNFIGGRETKMGLRRDEYSPKEVLSKVEKPDDMKKAQANMVVQLANDLKGGIGLSAAQEILLEIIKEEVDAEVKKELGNT